MKPAPVVQLVMMYDYNSQSLTQNLQELKSKPTTPSFHMMDDQLMRGEYPIIGNIPLEAEELSFPMHYGTYTNHHKRNFWLSYAC